MPSRYVSAAVIVAVVSGCASGPPPRQWYWYKPGGTQESFQVDRARCNMQAAQIPGASRVGFDPNTVDGSLQLAGRDLEEMADRSAFMLDCMRVAGWTERAR